MANAAVTAIGAIAKNKNWWEITKKVANGYMNSVFGCGQDAEFAKLLIKDKAGLKAAWDGSKLGESFFQRTKEALSFSNISQEFKDASTAVNFMGKEGKLAKYLGVAGRRMPFIMNVVTLACEVPNIIKAFTDKEHGGGVGAGLAETAKTGIKLGAFAAGMALGSLVPGVGFITGMIGGMAGQWLAEKIVGKSFTDKAAETDAAKQNAQANDPANQNNVVQNNNTLQTQTPPTGTQQIQPFQGNMFATSSGFDPNADFMSQTYFNNSNTTSPLQFGNVTPNPNSNPAPSTGIDTNGAFVSKRYAALA